MIDKHEREVFLCSRLARLGFVPGRRVKLWGEEFDLISDPAPEESGYGFEGISRKSGSLRHVRIPLSVVRTIEHEFYVMERMALTA